MLFYDNFDLQMNSKIYFWFFVENLQHVELLLCNNLDNKFEFLKSK